MTTLRLRVLLVSAFIASAVLLLFSAFSHGVTPDDITEYASQVVAHIQSSEPSVPRERLAYMTFLAGTMANLSDPDPDHDHYFVATRILGYQLMHQRNTRTRNDIPFVVMVTEDIPKQKREILEKDGAIVIKVDYLRAESDWIKGEMPEWRDVMTKLRAWELTQYTRVAFLDSDMILNRCLDGVFEDPATQTSFTRPDAVLPQDEAVPPEEYVLASVPEVNPFHSYPPSAENDDFKDPDYFNAGFFVFAPSKKLFAHFASLMQIEDRFDPRYPEQNLLNYAHRRDGKMPWKDMDISWNIRFPSIFDKDGGVASLHDKWWKAHMDTKLQPYYDSIRWRMEGFYEARDRGSH